MNKSSFTPALGRAELTGLYDRAIRLLTRERAWRSALLRQVAPRAGESILDVGCGTGTFAIMLKRAAPEARVIGLDPDPNVLELAAAKADRAGVRVEWRQGFAHDAATFAGTMDKAVSSLVLHQVPLDGKSAAIEAMFSAVGSGGEVHIADYARQPDWLMRALFRITVQLVDGREDTQPNAEGVLEAILAQHEQSAGISTVVIRTPTGAISLFRALQRGQLTGVRARLVPPVTEGFR